MPANVADGDDPSRTPGRIFGTTYVRIDWNVAGGLELADLATMVESSIDNMIGTWVEKESHEILEMFPEHGMAINADVRNYRRGTPDA